MPSPVRSAIVDENQIVMEYNPPGNFPPPFHNNPNHNNATTLNINPLANKPVQWVYNPSDGSVLRDHHGVPLSVDKLLATEPLKHELSTRPGPGNKKLTYISGDEISRTLNDVFGFDGWDLDIREVEKVDTSKDPKSHKYTVIYTARVRLTHKASGTYKEDCGAGDSTDRNLAIAIAHALKASITDAMKRAARHFGDKLGNSLYSGNFSIKKAPVSLRDALDKYDIRRCNTKFGFQKPTTMNNVAAPSTTSKPMIANNNNASVVSMLPPIGNESNIAAAQMYQNSGQPPQQQALSRATNHYTQQPQQSAISNIQPVSNGLVHSGNPQQHQASSRATTNHHPQQQKQSANSNIPPVPNGLVQQPHPGLKHGSSSSELNSTSGMARPTSSYGRKRPTPVSNVPVHNSGAISAKVAASSGTTGPIPAATSTGQQPFHPNNNDNNSRRVSLEDQKQVHRQVLPNHNNSQSTNAMNHVPSVVSQTPSTHGGSNHNSTTDNSYVAYSSNHTHKRPPLGAILGPNANGIYSSSESSSSNKRPKQQQIHHNPYNNNNNHQSGRKSI